MNEALCSILYGEDEWYYHAEGRHIKFNKDGTGEVSISLSFQVPDPLITAKSYGAVATLTIGSWRLSNGRASNSRVVQVKSSNFRVKFRILLGTKALSSLVDLILK